MRLRSKWSGFNATHKTKNFHYNKDYNKSHLFMRRTVPVSTFHYNKEFQRNRNHGIATVAQRVNEEHTARDAVAKQMKWFQFHKKRNRNHGIATVARRVGEEHTARDAVAKQMEWFQCNPQKKKLPL